MFMLLNFVSFCYICIEHTRRNGAKGYANPAKPKLKFTCEFLCMFIIATMFLRASQT